MRLRVEVEPDVFHFTPEALELTVGAIADVCGIRPTQVPALLQLQPRILVQVREMCGRCRKVVGRHGGVGLSE